MTVCNYTGYDARSVLLYRYQDVTHFDAAGEPMPRIPDSYLASVVYLYPTVYQADQGEHFGGSGFLIGIPSETKPQMVYPYAVTNSHVVREGKSPVVRLNGVDADAVIYEPPANAWTHHPDGDDVAVCFIPGSIAKKARARALGIDQFINSQIIQEKEIGVGSDVFMAGRFITHQGTQKNTPTMRFGNVSLMSPEPIPHPRGHLQESFLVEMRSLAGYSGSPVVVYLSQLADFGEIEADTAFHMAVFPSSSWLLGVVWGHSDWFEPVLESDRATEANEGWVVKSNSGIAYVVPSWKIKECLEAEPLTRQRDEFDRELKKQSVGEPTLDVNTPNELTQEQFEEILDQVSRPVTEPDAKESET